MLPAASIRALGRRVRASKFGSDVQYQAGGTFHGGDRMPTLSTVLSIAALALSVTNFIVTLMLTIRRDIGAIRPVLVFTYRSRVGWHIENIGNGPALDVVFNRLYRESVTQNVRLPTLAKGSEFFLHFAKHDSKQIFVATYRDADSRPYTSRSQHDVSTQTKGFAIQRPPDQETLDRWWQLNDSDE
jgi:hypothetical protein